MPNFSSTIDDDDDVIHYFEAQTAKASILNDRSRVSKIHTLFSITLLPKIRLTNELLTKSDKHWKNSN